MRAMRWFGWLCVLAMLSVTTVGAEQPAEADAPYTLVEASPTVVTAVHDNGSNISCVALADGLVFFDASLSTRTARHFRRAMETRFERPTIALVLTHAHIDHILGMGAFSDVEVIAAAAGRPRWERFVAVEWTDQAVAGFAAVFPTLPDEIGDAELRLPDVWFEDEHVLGGDGDAVTVRRTGGHTADSASVIAGDGRVVIAGDLVQARRRPYFGEPDTDFDAWIGALEDWEALDVGAVCPGHGPVIDRAELGEIRQWFQGAVAAMVEVKQRAASFDEVLADPGLPAGYWPADATVPRWWGFCVKRLYDAS
ncbi:MAG: MBL fold metallo-hydrolase [Candidatus Sulfomarinibacteraceae bacterium]